MEEYGLNKRRMGMLGAIFLLALTLFVIALTVKAFKEYRYVGYDPGNARNTITAHGEGEAFAVPDVATFSYSVTEEGKTVAEAQDKAKAKADAALKVLKDAGIEDKDVKTIGYNAYPKYEYQERATSVCPAGYCPPGKQVLTGYEVSNTIEVKVRKTDAAGDVLTKVGTTGVSNISSLEFRVDDDAKVQEEARSKAIADAKARAEKLAEQLGVRIVRVVSFSESGNYPYPMYAKLEMAADGRGGAGVASAPMQLPTGENKTVSSVDITFEIR